METGFGAQGQGLNDVCATPHTAVENHFQFVGHGIDDRTQGIDTRRHAIQLPPTVVGDHHPMGADLCRLKGIMDGVHTFDKELTAPFLGQPFRIFPGPPCDRSDR